jgi:hypothetical protein
LYFLRNTDFFVFEKNLEQIKFSYNEENFLDDSENNFKNFLFSQKISQTEKKFFISIKK